MKKLKLVSWTYTISFLYYSINLKCKEETTLFFSYQQENNFKKELLSSCWIFLVITLKVDHHQALKNYKKLLPSYFKTFNNIEYIEASIYSNQKPEKNHGTGTKMKYCNHDY